MSQIHEQANTDTCKLLNAFIVNHFPLARRRQLQYADSLLESGIIDSMGMLDVVAFIESEFNVRVEDEDLTSENFQSIAQMAAYVELKRKDQQ